MRIAVFALAPLFYAAGAQTSGAKLEFEAASVKPSAGGLGAGVIWSGGPGSGDPALFTCRSVYLKTIMVHAFGLRPFQVVAPDWTQDRRFDIRAAVPAGATKEQFEAMLQNLLIERFHLTFHREPRETTRYELQVAEGGPKLKDAQDAAAPPDTAAPKPAGPPNPMVGRKIPLDEDGYPIVKGEVPGFAIVDGRARYYQPHGPVESMLSSLEMLLDKPMVNATGLQGSYEIELHWAGQAAIVAQMRAMAQARASAGPPAGQPSDPGIRRSGPTIQQALRDQLGLKLELKKGPVETVVIDRVDRVPTEN